MKYKGKETYIKLYLPEKGGCVTDYHADNIVISDNGIEFDRGGLDRMGGKEHVVVRGIPFMVVEREIQYEEIPGEEMDAGFLEV